MFEYVDYGVLVMDIMGIHTANPISGDFSVGISGFVIKNGKRDHLLKGMIIVGNPLEVLRNVEMVGDDLRFWGKVNLASLLIKNMNISG